QAEDGILRRTVTGVQTCALPIFPRRRAGEERPKVRERVAAADVGRRELVRPQVLGERSRLQQMASLHVRKIVAERPVEAVVRRRSEERRVGKEGVSRAWTDPLPR